MASAILSTQNARADGSTDPSSLDPQQRARALQLADEGLALFERGDFAAARERLEQAESIIAIPTFTLQKGRALERLGRWAEALAAYQKVARADLPKSAPAQHQQAKKDAEKYAADLSSKVPRVHVTMAHNAPADIYVDGRSYGPVGPTALLLDPGDHIVEARGADGRSVRQSINLRIGDTQKITLDLAPAQPASSGPSVFAVLGYTAIGISGASLITAVATGVPAILMSSELEDACPDGQCPPDEHDKVDRYDALKWAAGVTLIAGAAFAAAGITLVLVDPERTSKTPTVRAHFGPTNVGLSVMLP